jgi:hypothetical protein
MAIPGLVAARLTEAQLGAAGFFGRVGAAVGLGSSNSVALTVRLKSLASLSIDEGLALRELRLQRPVWLQENLSPDQLLRHVSRVRRDLAVNMCKGEDEAVNQTGARVLVANQIVYASRVEYEFGRSSATAALAQADLSALSRGRSGAIIPDVVVSPAGSIEGPDTLATLSARVRAVQQALADSIPTSPGFRASLGVGTLGGLALNEDFTTPVAVGLGSPIYFSLSGSLVALGQTPEAAEAVFLRGIRSCAQLLGITTERLTKPVAPMLLPEPLRQVASQMCDNSLFVLEEARPPGALPSAPYAPGEEVCPRNTGGMYRARQTVEPVRAERGTASQRGSSSR